MIVPALAFCLAFVVRLAYLLMARPSFDGAYWALASGLLHDGSLAIDGVRITGYEPLYPVFLAAARLVAGDRLFVVQLLQITVASLGAVFMYRLTNALTASTPRTSSTSGIPRTSSTPGTLRTLRTPAGTLAAVLFAVDPLLVKQAVEHSDAPLVTTLLVACACAFVVAKTARAAAWAGVLVGLTVLARSMVLPLVVLGAAILVVERRRGAALALTLAALVVVAPLPIRNHAVNGSWLPTRGGVNLFVGNNAYTAALLPEDDIDLLEGYAYSVVEQSGELTPGAANNEQVANTVLTRRALAFMAADPLRTAGQKLRNAWYFFSPRLVPYRTRTDDTRLVIGPEGRVTVEGSTARPLLENVAYSAWYPLVLVCALAGVFLRRRALGRDAILWAIVVTFVAVSVVYFPATRYRGPMSFVLLFYAAVAVSQITTPLSRFGTRS